MNIQQIKDLSGSHDRSAFRKWFADAVPGEKVIYHTGEFCSGPYKGQALELAEAEQINIVQVRLGERKFAYVAIKSKKRRAA
jgi:hypothetical protein